MYQYKVKQKEKPNKSMSDIRQRHGGQKGSAAFGGTGLSREMKEKYESLSGYSFDDVRVHYNSGMPAQIHSLAYTQGNQVYLMPGQERHLEHELGHVVQQKKGIVKPTGTIGGIPVNDDEALEAEASMYGRGAHYSFHGEQNMQKGHSGFVAQRYKKAGEYTLAAGPGQPPGERLLMVKDNEPGALYIHTTAADAQVPEELGKLGILPGGTQEASPLPEETPQGLFKRYEQGRIPKIIDRTPVRREIPGYHLTLWQKFCSCFTPQMRTEYEPQQESSQPLRTCADVNSVVARLAMQQGFLQSCLADGAILRTHIQAQAQWQDCVERWKSNLEKLSQTGEDEEFISYCALGSDVLSDIKAIYGVAEQEERQAEDRLLALNIAMEDLEYRLKQVEQEIRTARFMPQLPTACNTSASMRSMLINGVGRDDRSVKADFRIERRDPFEEIVNWTYHFATPIPAASLTSDMLMIEDAVGKSLGPKEVMNAHWAAHIYGNEEREDGQGIALTDLRPAEGRQGVFQGISRCRFNQMSDISRQNFCNKYHIGEHTWSMMYMEQSTDTVYGTLKFYIDENWKIAYEMAPEPDQNFTPGMQHFLISTADAIAEDFVLRDFADEDAEEYAEEPVVDNRRIQVRQSPSTRYDSSYHSLEEFRVVR